MMHLTPDGEEMILEHIVFRLKQLFNAVGKEWNEEQKEAFNIVLMATEESWERSEKAKKEAKKKKKKI